MKQNTASKILDTAQSMVRNRGYSAFSYADIAEQVGIRKASIHYHFPSKDDLVKELVKRYRDTLSRKCQAIAKQGITPEEQLGAFVNLYRDSLQDNQICLCAMLTADFSVLNSETRDELKAFFAIAESWLSELLKRGSEAKAWQCTQSYESEAKSIIAMLQGAQLMARATEDSLEAFDQIAEGFLRNKLEN